MGKKKQTKSKKIDTLINTNSIELSENEQEELIVSFNENQNIQEQIKSSDSDKKENLVNENKIIVFEEIPQNFGDNSLQSNLNNKAEKSEENEKYISSNSIAEENFIGKKNKINLILKEIPENNSEPSNPNNREENSEEIKNYILPNSIYGENSRKINFENENKTKSEILQNLNSSPSQINKKKTTAYFSQEKNNFNETHPKENIPNQIFENYDKLDKSSMNSISKYIKFEYTPEECEQLKTNLMANNRNMFDLENLTNYTKNSNEVVENEIFRMTRYDNAIKIRKEILKIQNRADKYAEKLYSIMRNFENIKNNLLNRYNTKLTSLLIYFGFNHRLNLEKSNFFILVSEAWIIEISRMLEIFVKNYLENPQTFNNEENIKINSQNEEEKENQSKIDEENSGKKNPIQKNIKIEDIDPILLDYPNNFTFSSLLKKIITFKIDKESYLTNLSILTGGIYTQSYFSATTKLIENNIGKIYLNSLNYIIKNYNFPELEENEELDLKKFENCLIRVFRLAVEKTLNTMDNQFSDDQNNSNIKYLDCFEKFKTLKKSTNKKITYDEYVKYLINEKKYLDSLKINLNDNFSLKICTESFFYFCLFKFEEILDDIRTFNINFNYSLNFRFRSFITSNFTRIIDISRRNFFISQALTIKIIKSFIDKIKLRTIVINQIYDFYKMKYHDIFKTIDFQKNKVVKTYTFVKKWVDSSSKTIKNQGKKFYENHLISKYKFLLNNMFMPVYNFSVVKSNNIWEFMVIKKKIYKNKLNSYNSKIVGLMEEKKNKIKEKIGHLKNKIDFSSKLDFLKEENSRDLFEITQSKDKEYFEIKINKKMFGNIFGKIKNLKSAMNSLIKDSYKNSYFKLVTISSNLLKFSEEKKNNFCEYIENNYNEIIENE